MSTAGDDDPKVALAIIYGLSYKEDSASGVKITSKALPFSLSTDSAVQKSYAKGHLDSSVTNGIVFTLRGQDVLTLGEIRLENMNLPPRDIMEKIYFIAPTDINDDEAFGIFQNFFAGPKPLIGVFSLKDLKTSSILLDISLDKLNITNPSTSPYALEVSLEHLKMPVALVPELQLLSVMGVPEIDASASYAISLPNKDNQFNSTAPSASPSSVRPTSPSRAKSPIRPSLRSSTITASPIPILRTLLKRTSSSATSKRDTLMKGSCPASASSARSSWA